jgi:broad specificity phosphatase PhoE
VLKRARATRANVLVFSSGHFLRVLAARWMGLTPAAGRYLLLSTTSVSAVGYQHRIDQPVHSTVERYPSRRRVTESLFEYRHILFTKRRPYEHANSHGPHVYPIH